ncbi:MAG TPA: hypothetical protein VFD67_06675, partial [Gemmatimonadaceae bacterium]|nr:hypothetical protein [Gemmatimonadaceae bacterium]
RRVSGAPEARVAGARAIRTGVRGPAPSLGDDGRGFQIGVTTVTADSQRRAGRWIMEGAPA